MISKWIFEMKHLKSMSCTVVRQKLYTPGVRVVRSSMAILAAMCKTISVFQSDALSKLLSIHPIFSPLFFLVMTNLSCMMEPLSADKNEKKSTTGYLFACLPSKGSYRKDAVIKLQPMTVRLVISEYNQWKVKKRKKGWRMVKKAFYDKMPNRKRMPREIKKE